MPKQRVLAVDDDPKMLSLLRRGLSLAGYEVDLAADGPEALEQAHLTSPDLVLIDVMLPELDGLELCRRLRASRPSLPIVMVTAKGRVPDRVAGLDAGADDYLVKPFALDELLARMRALLRRSGSSAEDVLRYSDLSLDPITREVRRGERVIELTSKEYELLEFFLRHPRQVFTRESIFAHVWDYDFLGESNVIDVHVRRLRAKLEEGGQTRLLQTVRGTGYCLREG